MIYLYDACDQISDFCHQQLLRKMRRNISWTDGRTDGRKEGRTDRQTDRGKTVYLPPPSGSGCITKIGWADLVGFIHIEHICSFFVAFFSATIDDRNLIFSHKLLIGTPISWEAFFEPSDSYFLFAKERGYHMWALANSSSCSVSLILRA
jgi:hypothetical protein